MRRAVVLLSVLTLVTACGGSGVDQSGSSVGTGAVPPAGPGGQPIVIRLRLMIVDEEGAEVPATGEILEGSTLGSKPFCVGGATEDRHASTDPAAEPHGVLVRAVTCPDGTLKLAFTPGQPQGLTQTGSWTIVSGTDAFEGLEGSGNMEITYDAVDRSLAHETLTGTVTP